MSHSHSSINPAESSRNIDQLEQLYKIDMWLLQAALLQFEERHGKIQALAKADQFNFKPPATNYVLSRSYYMGLFNKPPTMIHIDPRCFKQTDYTLSQHLKIIGLTKRCQVLLTAEQFIKVKDFIREMGLTTDLLPMKDVPMAAAVKQKRAYS